MRIINSDDAFDYYIWFNFAKGFNEGTREAKDLLAITKRAIGSYYEDSRLIARLEEDQSFIISEYAKGVNIAIKPSKYYYGVFPSHVRINIRKLLSNCEKDLDCNDGNLCTSDRCIHRTCEYEDLACEDCGNMVYLKLIADEILEDLVWEIEDLNEKKIVRTSGTQLSQLNDSSCFQIGTYQLSMYRGNKTMLENVKFKLLVGNSIADTGKIDRLHFIETVFIICSLDEDCFDYDGCTDDICNQTSKRCENIINPICNNCSNVTLQIVPDNYIEETTWDISEQHNKIQILSGDPYPIHLRTFGRRKAPAKAGRRKAPTRASAKEMSNDYKMLTLESSNILKENICLAFGYTYYFAIRDSFGDGICCSEGIGSYNVTIGDLVVKSGGDFGDYESFYFRHLVCSQDKDCDDSNPCTSDLCLASIAICFYTLEPCVKCGMEVIFKINTDWAPFQNSWKITKDNSIVMQGGPYKEAYKESVVNKCLPFGSYLLNVTDSYGDGKYY